MRRSRRKHLFLALGAAIVLGLLLFPLLSGKRISPADIVELYAPWKSGAAPQNGLMNDPATSWLARTRLIFDEPGSFVWNPFIGAGTAGWHSAGLGMLTPFALIPAIVLPPSFFFAGVGVMKFLAALLLAYGWLRQERLGRKPAAIGALICAGAGTTAIAWFWYGTNATVLCPGVLWIVARMRHGRRTPIPLVAFLALAILWSGFPAAILYVAYLGFAYAVYAALVAPVNVRRTIANVVAGCLIASAIAAPALIPFIQTIRRSAYLELRSDAFDVAYPASHLAAFVKPYRLISPGAGWRGDARLRRNDNFVESTIYVGKLPMLLALLGLTVGRKRRWFWVAAGTALVAAMFGVPVIRDAIGALPGMQYTPLTRLRVMLPFAVAFLAASFLAVLWRRPRSTGLRRRLGATAALIVAVIALDQALFLRSFTPYIAASRTMPRDTPGLRFLRSQPGAFRVAALGTTLWPDTAEFVQLEDIRSHYPVEREYRELLATVDPHAFGRNGTVILFDPASIDLESPILDRLNVRFMLDAADSRAMDDAIARGKAPSWSAVYRGRDLLVYRNSNARERFYADGPAAITIARPSLSRFVVSTQSSQSFFLESSEKVSDEQRVQLDGTTVRPVATSGSFAAVRVPAGRHRVVFDRIIPRPRLAIGIAGLLALLLSCAPYLRRQTSKLHRVPTAR